MVREPVWAPRIVVEAVHLDQIRAHGGLAGIRDEAALESALARPPNKFAYGTRADDAALAAAYAFGIARGHPFNDGNKRVAFLIGAVYLGLNGWDFDAPDEEVVAKMVALAAGRFAEPKLVSWLRTGMRKQTRRAT